MASGAPATPASPSASAGGRGVPSSESSDCSQGSAERRGTGSGSGISVSSVAARMSAATCAQLIPTAQLQWPARNRSGNPAEARNAARSEEHTSELQSRRDLVCRLLLEKKKKK